MFSVFSKRLLKLEQNGSQIFFAISLNVFCKTQYYYESASYKFINFSKKLRSYSHRALIFKPDLNKNIVILAFQENCNTKPAFFSVIMLIFEE